MPSFEVTAPDGKRYQVTAPEGVSENEVIARVRREAAGKPAEPTWGETAKDYGQQAAYGVGRGITALPNLAYMGLQKATGSELLGNLEDSPVYQEMHTPAETAGGRYIGSVSEFAGGSAVPFGAAYRAARALPEIAPAAEGFFARHFLRPIQAAPGKALAGEAGAAVAGGSAQQAAADADLPVWAQIGAGLAGGIGGGVAAQGRLPRAPASTAPLGVPGSAGAARVPPPPLSPADRQTYQLVSDTLRAEGKTPADIDAYLERLDWSRRYHSAGVDPVSGEPLYSEAPSVAGLAEMSPGLQRLVGHEVRHNFEAADTARRAFAVRQLGYAREGEPHPELGLDTLTKYDPQLRMDKVGGAEGRPATSHYDRMEVAQRRLLRIEDEAHHRTGRTAAQTDEMILADQKAKANKTFGNARLAGEGVDLSRQGEVADAFKNLQTAAAREDLTPDIASDLKWMVKQYAPSGTLVKSITDFDRARRVVSERIGDLLRGTGGKLSKTTAAELQDAQSALVGAARNVKKNNLGAIYAKGLDDFGDDARMLKDVQLGRDIFEGKVPRTAFDELPSREAQNRAKLGYHSAWQEKNSPRSGRLDLTKSMDSDKHRADLAYLAERSGMHEDKINPNMTRDLGSETGAMMPTQAVYRDRPERFEAYTGLEEAMQRTKETAQGGSPTAGRLADDFTFDTLHHAADILKNGKGPTEVAMRALEYGFNKIFGLRADVSSNIVRKLLSRDPDVRATAAANIKMLLGSQTKQERFNQLMKDVGRRSRRGAPSATGAATGNNPEAAE